MKEVSTCMQEDRQLQEQLAKEAQERAIYDARLAREEASRDAALLRRKAAEAGLRALLDSEEHTAKPGRRLREQRAVLRGVALVFGRRLISGAATFSGDPKGEFDAALRSGFRWRRRGGPGAHRARAAASGPENKEAVESTAQRALDAAAAASTASILYVKPSPKTMDASKDWSSAAEALARFVGAAVH